MLLLSHVSKRNISDFFFFFFNELSEIAFLGLKPKNSCIVFEEKKHHICSVNIYASAEFHVYIKPMLSLHHLRITRFYN